MKKTIIYLTVIFAVVIAQKAICQPTPPANEAIKLLWQGGYYNSFYPTYDGKFMFGNKTVDSSTIFYKLDATNGNVVDSITILRQYKAVVDNFAFGDNYNLIYFTAILNAGKDSIYCYNCVTKELRALKIKYQTDHSNYIGVQITRDSKYLNMYEIFGANQSRTCYSLIFDLRGDSIKYFFKSSRGIVFNNKGNRLFSYSREDKIIGEYSIETGQLINNIDLGFSQQGIRQLSVSIDDKYLIATNAENSAIFNFYTNQVELIDKISSGGIPVVLNDNKLMLCFNMFPIKDIIFNWHSKKIIHEIPFPIWGVKYLRNNLLIAFFKGYIQVCQLDLTILGVPNILPAGITIDYTALGNSNYQIRINSNKFFKMELQISNLTGNIFRKETKLINEGENIINCNLSGLPIGSYFINLKADGINKTIKILKEMD